MQVLLTFQGPIPKARNKNMLPITHCPLLQKTNVPLFIATPTNSVAITLSSSFPFFQRTHAVVAQDCTSKPGQGSSNRHKAEDTRAVVSVQHHLVLSLPRKKEQRYSSECPVCERGQGVTSE